MQRTPMARTGIAKLNQLARKYEREGCDGPSAVAAAAHQYGLISVRAYDESGILYRTKRNRYVFGWTNHATVAAGCGFDDQVNDL